MFETNWRHDISSVSKVIWLLILLEWRLLMTCFYLLNHVTFWSFGHFTIKVHNFLKAHSQKIEICLKVIENIISSVSKVVWLLNLLEWRLLMTCCYLQNHVTFWSFGHFKIKVHNFLKGHSQKIEICLKVIENIMSSVSKVVWLLNLLEWRLLITCYCLQNHATFWSLVI